jgi:hypothetical protein
MGHDFQVERGESFGEWVHYEMLLRNEEWVSPCRRAESVDGKCFNPY